MKKIAVLGLVLLAWCQSYGQPQKEDQFTEKVFASSFTDADKTTWPVKNNQFYVFLIQDGQYMVESMAEGKKAFMLPRNQPQLSAFRMEAWLRFDPKTGKDGTLGMAVNVHPKLEDGYVVEINPQREFRVSQIRGAGDYRILTGNADKGGWLSAKSLNKIGMENKLDVIYSGSTIKVLCNDREVYVNSSVGAPAGQSGLFISGLCKGMAKHYTIYGPAPVAKDTTSLFPGMKGEIKDTSEEVLPADINTLTASLVATRKEAQACATQNESCQIELAQNKRKVDELQAFIQNNLDLKLQAELEIEKKKNEVLQKELEQLKKDNAGMSTLTNQVEESKDGDLVMVLTKNLKKEQEANKRLKERISYLEWQMRVLKAKPK